MRGIIMAVVAGLLATGSAQAYCVNLPDNAASSYVENNTQRTVCLQQELSDKMNLNQEIQSQTDAALMRMQTELTLQKMQLEAREAQSGFRTP